MDTQIDIKRVSITFCRMLIIKEFARIKDLRNYEKQN